MCVADETAGRRRRKCRKSRIDAVFWVNVDGYYECASNESDRLLDMCGRAL